MLKSPSERGTGSFSTRVGSTYFQIFFQPENTCDVSLYGWAPGLQLLNLILSFENKHTQAYFAAAEVTAKKVKCRETRPTGST
jgi:hypothetical protein